MFDFVNTATVPSGANSWIDNGSAGISVVTQGVISAPAAVVLEAINITGMGVSSGSPYDPQWDQLEYWWEVRGQPLANFTKPQNVIPIYKNANIRAGGKRAVFSFPDSGTYDIDLYVYNPATLQRAQATVQITVVDEAFSSANTIVFASDGVYTGAPGSTTQVSTIAALNSAMQGRTSRTRVSFKPGETLEQVNLEPGDGQVVRIDTWDGTTTTFKPWQNRTAVQPIWFNSDVDVPDLSVVGITFLGEWDPTTEMGDYGVAGTISFGAATATQFITFHDCTFRNNDFVQITIGTSSSSNNHLAFIDCAVDGFRGYGFGAFTVEDSRDKFYFVGCNVVQNVNALAGGSKNGMKNDHGCLRIANGAEFIYLYGCYWFSLGGWSGSPPPANAVLRLHSTVSANSKTICIGNTTEGGYAQIKIDGQNDGDAAQAPEYGGSHLIERNLCIGTARDLSLMRFDYGGTTVRGNLLCRPASTRFESLVGEFITISPDDPGGPRDNDQPVKVISNSFVNLSSDVKSVVTGNPAGFFTSYEFANNVEYQTNGSTSDSPDVSTVMPGVTPSFNGVRFGYGVYSTSINVANGASFTIPYASLNKASGYTIPNGGGPLGDTSATDQAYWQAAESAGNDLHMMNVGGTVYFAERGDFTVSYSDGTNVTITNTSGGTLSGTAEIMLDRRTHMDTDLPLQTQFANPSTIPNCRATASTPNRSSGSLSLFDLFGTERDLSSYKIGCAEAA